MSRKFTVMAIIFCLSTQLANATDYYWIGNGGDWKNTSHWSLTSGGVSAGVTPTISDNVRFDANSFTLPGQIVFIADDSSSFGAGFKTMDWRGVTNNPTFRIKVVTSPYMGNDCYGSLYFDDNMTLDFKAAEFYMQSPINYDFDTRGHYLGENAWIWFNAQSAVIGNILSDINHAWIYAAKGTVKFNGHSFLGINNANNVENPNYPAIWLQNAAATLDISNSTVDVGTIQFANGSTLIDNNATLRIRNRFTASNKDFNHVVFDTVTMVGGSANNIFQTLEITPGSVVTFINTHTINNLIANGTNELPVGITGGTITKSSGSISVHWANITHNTATGGAVFNAYESTKADTVIGWSFRVVPSDSLALVALYNSTNGAGWTTRTNWLVGGADTWHGVTTNAGRVTALVLGSNNLTGTLPAAIGNLTSLVDLQLWANQITGPVPTTIGNLVDLTYMDLSPNEFTGTIPIEIGNLVNLGTLWMNHNNFTGSVPAEFVNLTQLTNLYLQNNQLTDLPDLSSLPLTVFEVDNNNFDFDDLEPNVGITGFAFSPQAPNIGTFSETLVEVGNTHTVTAEGGGASGQYQWKRNGQNIGGADQKDYDIVGINRSNMGDYTVQITNPLLPGITITTAAQRVLATADISGTFFESSNTAITSGVMRLLKVTPTGSYDTTQLQNVNSNGTYLFDNVILDDYLINGFADTTILSYKKAIPTYYVETIFWEEADTLVLEDNVTALDIYSAFKPEPPTTGQGEITGTFYGVDDPEDRVGARARVGGAAVTVRRGQGSGRGKDNFTELVAYTFTDENGEFNFDKLDVNEYKLNIQLPGYPMDMDSYIIIPVGGTMFDRQVGVSAEVNNGKIEVRKLVITGWQEENHSFSAYPNPTVDYLFVKSAGDDRNITFQLNDASGKAIHVPVEWNLLEQRWELNIRDLKQGVYILQVHKNKKTESAKVLIK